MVRKLNNAGTTVDKDANNFAWKRKHQSFAGTLSGKFQTSFCYRQVSWLVELLKPSHQWGFHPSSAVVIVASAWWLGSWTQPITPPLSIHPTYSCPSARDLHTVPF